MTDTKGPSSVSGKEATANVTLPARSVPVASGEVVAGSVTFTRKEVWRVAAMCHEVNRLYCMTLGDYSQRGWMAAPAWQRESVFAGVEVALRTFGETGRFDPAGQHESWTAKKVAEGWKYGPVKDENKKTHPCLLPYEQLPSEQRLKDYYFLGVVSAIWRAKRDGVEVARPNKMLDEGPDVASVAATPVAATPVAATPVAAKK